MPRYVFGTNDPVEAGQIMALLAGGSQQAPPPGRPTALPVPAAAAPPAAMPPPPTPAVPTNSANPRLDNVIKLMDAYAKAGHQVAGVRKVLGMVGLARAQDANEEQLVWLEQAFANTSWTPPG